MNFSGKIGHFRILNCMPGTQMDIKVTVKSLFILIVQGMKYCFCKLCAIFFAFENTTLDVARISEFDVQKLLEMLNNQIKRSFATVGQDNRSWTHQVKTAKNLRQVDSMVFLDQWSGD